MLVTISEGASIIGGREGSDAQDVSKIAAVSSQLRVGMPIQRTAPSGSVVDVLDHVLDKGIVLDAWVQVSLVGINLLTVEARVVVASIETYVTDANAIAELSPFSRPKSVVHPLHGRSVPDQQFK